MTDEEIDNFWMESSLSKQQHYYITSLSMAHVEILYQAFKARMTSECPINLFPKEVEKE